MHICMYMYSVHFMSALCFSKLLFVIHYTNVCVCLTFICPCLTAVFLLTVVTVAIVGIVIKRKRTMKAAIWRPEGPNGTPRSDSFDEDSPTAKRIVPGKERSSK